MDLSAGISLTFLESSETYTREKPYELHLAAVPEGLSRTNLQLKEYSGIPLTDVRGNERQYTLEENDFEYLKFSTSALALPLKAHVTDMNDPLVKEYLQEIIGLVKRRVHCERALLFDWRLRREGALDFKHGPRSTDRLASLAVAEVVHQDYSYNGGFARLERQLSPEEIARYSPEKYKVRIYNIWRPLVDVVKSAPLTIADRTTFRKADLAEVDKVHEDHLEEGILAHYNVQQKWFWLSEQAFDEPIMFLVWDSEGCDPVLAPPHASFQLPNGGAHDALRESIEVRVMTFIRRE